MGGEVRVKLMDFGLARTFDSRLTTEGMIVGTVSYLAPEQALGQAIDGRTDLYALGVMLYELTTGRLPFTADDPIAVISQHLYAPVVSPHTHNESIPPELDGLIVRLMSKQADQRPATASEVLRSLEQISAGERVPFIISEGPRHNLPAQPSRFIGRERELAEIEQLLSDPACRLLTLVGAGGMGKTRLALEVAQRNLEKFPAGVWLTELAPIDRDESCRIRRRRGDRSAGPTAAFAHRHDYRRLANAGAAAGHRQLRACAGWRGAVGSEDSGTLS